MATSPSAPVASHRHRRLDTSVWKNERGEKRQTFYNTTLRKSYKDGEEWKSTAASFNRENLLPAAKLLEWADTAIGKAIEKDVKAESEKKPVASKKRGLLEVAVWQRTGEEGTYYRASLKRSFKDGEEWKESRVWLMSEDCLPAARLLMRSFDTIDELASQPSGSFVESAQEQFSGSVVDPDEDIPF